MPSKLIDEKWIDGNGRKHRRYTVRSARNGYFIPVDVVLNVCPLANGDHIFTRRQDVWDWLRNTPVVEEEQRQGTKANS